MWQTVQVEIDGRPTLILLDDRFSNQAPIAKLPRLVWIGIWCRLPAGGGFWDPAEEVELDRIEDKLIAQADHHGRGWAIYELRICTPGLREYYFYVGEQARLRTAHDNLTKIFPNYRMEYDEKPDATWELYRKWLHEVRRGHSLPQN